MDGVDWGRHTLTLSTVTKGERESWCGSCAEI